MSLLKPDFYLKNIFSINIEFLKQNNIKALLLDADNTLCIYHTDVPVEGVTEWIDKMQQEGISLHILSNAKSERLINFATNIDLPYFYLSLKPLPFKISKAVKKLGFKKSEVALVGDQMFTDILGGNLSGVKTIWLDYIKLEDSKFFRLKRKIEYKIKSKLTRGD